MRNAYKSIYTLLTNFVNFTNDKRSCYFWLVQSLVYCKNCVLVISEKLSINFDVQNIFGEDLLVFR